MVILEKTEEAKMEDAFQQVRGLVKKFFPKCDADHEDNAPLLLKVRKKGFLDITRYERQVAGMIVGSSALTLYNPDYLNAAKNFADSYSKIIGKEVKIYTDF